MNEKDPIPVKPWAGVLNAIHEGSPCVQLDSILFNMIGNEDCLVLNVYTPAIVRNENFIKSIEIQKLASS
jgi:carboxylesterase type B